MRRPAYGNLPLGQHGGVRRVMEEGHSVEKGIPSLDSGEHNARL